jgi:hypothetical protein
MALACGATIEVAAQTAGVSPATVYRRKQDPAFCKELQQVSSELVQRMAGMLTGAGGEAVRTLLTLMKETAPPAVRLGAARAVMDGVVKYRDIGGVEERLVALEEQFAVTLGVAGRDCHSRTSPTAESSPPTGMGPMRRIRTMRLRTRLRRLEQLIRVDRGCPACRSRRGQIKWVESQRQPDGTTVPLGDWPIPCELCGKVPEMLVEIIMPVPIDDAAKDDPPSESASTAPPFVVMETDPVEGDDLMGQVVDPGGRRLMGPRRGRCL